MRDGWKHISVEIAVDKELYEYACTLPTGPGIRQSPASRNTALKRLLTRKEYLSLLKKELRLMLREARIKEEIPHPIFKRLSEVIDR